MLRPIPNKYWTFQELRKKLESKACCQNGMPGETARGFSSEIGVTSVAGSGAGDPEMCLAVPGKVLSVEGEDPAFRSALVDFCGVHNTVNGSCP